METFKMTKDKVVESPKDTTLDGVIVEIKRSSFSQQLNEEQKQKFENPESLLTERLFIKVDCNGHMVDENYPYHENPSDNTKLGKFLLKYDVLTVGVKVKVQFNSKGIGNISIE